MKRIINISVFILLYTVISLNNSLYTEAIVVKDKYYDKKEILNSINLQYWNNYNDPVLVEHIQQMLNNNHDLEKALLNISASRAKVRESLGSELPQMTLLSNFIRINPPALNNGKRKHMNMYTLPLYANYELDLWQKRRKTTIAQTELLKISSQNARTIYIIQLTELTSAYINILKLDKIIEMQHNLIEIEKQNLNIAQQKHNAGLASRDEQLESEQSLISAEITLKKLSQQREVFINHFKVLKGESPEQKTPVDRSSIDTLTLPVSLPANISSEKILLRPDIIAAEAELNYAKINVSIARRAFLPDINIYGLFGFNSFALGKLFNWDNYLASVGTSLIGQLFTGGQKKARLKQRKFEYEQMIQNYQKTILLSLQEVNDSLYSFKTNLEVFEDDQSNVNSEIARYNLATVRYSNGLSSLQETLPSKKKLIILQQETTNSKVACLMDSINLYKAMGGQL